MQISKQQNGFYAVSKSGNVIAEFANKQQASNYKIKQEQYELDLAKQKKYNDSEEALAEFLSEFA